MQAVVVGRRATHTEGGAVTHEIIQPEAAVVFVERYVKTPRNSGVDVKLNIKAARVTVPICVNTVNDLGIPEIRRKYPPIVRFDINVARIVDVKLHQILSSYIDCKIGR